MKSITFHLIILLSIFIDYKGLAQETNTAKTLVEQGIGLHDAGKYPEAVEKYKQAIQLEPNNTMALYELANTLHTTGKNDEALNYLENIIKINQMPEAFNLLGNIYDDKMEGDKAVDYYKKGIKYNFDYQRLHYNLAISYYRQKKFPEASITLIAALKLDPKHASSHRLYAMTAQQLNRNAEALEAYCNFLLLEPQTQRSAEAYKNLLNIFSSRATKTGDKAVTINVNTLNDADPSSSALELSLGLAAASASLEKNLNKTPVEVLEDQLKTIFGIAGELSAKKKNKSFLWSFYADYFYNLSTSKNMPAFIHYISLTGNALENKKWLQDNKSAFVNFSEWVAANERKSN